MSNSNICCVLIVIIVIVIIISLQSCRQNACWLILMCWRVVLESGWSSLRQSQVVCVSILCCICCRHCICQNVPWNNSPSVRSPLPMTGCSTFWPLCCWINSAVTGCYCFSSPVSNYYFESSNSTIHAMKVDLSSHLCKFRANTCKPLFYSILSNSSVNKRRQVHFP